MPKISQYPEAGTLTGSERVLLNQNGATKTTAASALFSALGSTTSTTASSGAVWAISTLSETTSIESGVTTQSSVLQIPVDAVVLAVCTEVTARPGGTSTMTVRGASSQRQFSAGEVSTVATTSDKGTNGCPVYVGAAEAIEYVFNTATTDALGLILLTLFYYTVTP